MLSTAALPASGCRRRAAPHRRRDRSRGSSQARANVNNIAQALRGVGRHMGMECFILMLMKEASVVNVLTALVALMVAQRLQGALASLKSGRC